MRLFVAVEIEPEVIRTIASCADTLRRRSTRAPRAHITWVLPDRFHVTLRFIGQVDAGRAQAIAAALAPDLPFVPFELTLQGVSTFPEHGAPRVVWAGVGAGATALTSVEREVSARLDRCGVAREDRSYHPHVTLARIRESGGLRTATWLEGLRDLYFGVSSVKAITLFESRPSPQGHAYVALQHSRLMT